MVTTDFLRYFDHLDEALAPELVASNISRVEMHTKGPLGNFWPETTELLRGILNQRQVVFQGVYWVEGTAQSLIRDYPLRFPLLRRRVQLERDQNGNALLSNPGPWEPGSAVADHPDLAGVDTIPVSEDPYGDRDLRRVADAFVADLDPAIYRVRLSTSYGLWIVDGDPGSVTLFPPSTQSDPPTAFGAVYGLEPAPNATEAGPDPDGDQPDRETPQALVTPVVLNHEQRIAIQQARDLDITVISGPPGTGKTHALTAIIFEQLVAARATLIVTATEPAREAIETMLSAYEALPVVRFGRDVSPVVLGNALAERATSLRVQGRSGDLTKTLRRLDGDWSRYQALAASVLGAESPTTPPSGRRWWRRVARRSPRSDGTHGLDGEHRAAGENRVDDVLDRLYRCDQQRREVAVDHFAATYLGTIKPGQRRKLAALARALRLDPMARRDALGDLDAGVVSAAPIWLGTLDSVDSFLPPVESMFDLVIFDEASQISQLDAVGALRRARRALVVGDPHQMRHEPRTTAAQRQAAAEAANLSGSDRAIVDESRLSLYDVAAGAAPVTRLVDHYRSSPHIIAFSNKHFYADALRLMTRHPWRESRDSIHLVNTRASIGPVARAQIDTAIQTARTAQGHGYGSVGVVVPDADNVAYATEVAKAVLGPQQSASPWLRIGEPRSFQGIEIDVMIIVTGVGQGPSTPLALDRLDIYEDPNILNTVITRARYDVYVILGHAVDDLPDGLWRSYLESEDRPPYPTRSRVADESWKRLLAAETEQVGDLDVRIDYQVGPHLIDLVVGPGRLAFGVFTAVHRDGVDAHIERYFALRDLGWKLMHVLETDWSGRDPEAVIEIVRRAQRVQR